MFLFFIVIVIVVAAYVGGNLAVFVVRSNSISSISIINRISIQQKAN